MLGISINEYEYMTPRQLSIRVQAYKEVKMLEAEEYQVKLKNYYELAITQAWLTANWQRAKKMPNLDKVLKTNKPKQKEMTDEQMLNQIKALNAMFGGAVNNNVGQ
ncbi:MAG: hypothetical protein K0S04_336 [Herbinix sp.]|jgi:hypothetical protein|nr:hypothetical protein [Herbinix sp.]